MGNVVCDLLCDLDANFHKKFTADTLIMVTPL